MPGSGDPGARKQIRTTVSCNCMRIRHLVVGQGRAVADDVNAQYLAPQLTRWDIVGPQVFHRRQMSGIARGRSQRVMIVLQI